MSGYYRGRRTRETRDPIQVRLAETLLVVSAVVVAATLLSWPWTGLWDSPSLSLLLTGVSFGVISPGNFQTLLIYAVMLLAVTIFVLRWAARSKRFLAPSPAELERQYLRFRMAMLLSLKAFCSGVVANASSPQNSIWSSASSTTMMTIGTLGIVVPANFPLFLTITIVFAVSALAAWIWTFRSVRVRNHRAKTAEEPQAVSPDRFEDWVADHFRNLGYSVEITGSGNGDHGVDLLARKPGEFAAIQCKYYRSWAVGEPVLRDLLGAMLHYGADRGYLVDRSRIVHRGSALLPMDGDRPPEHV